MAAGTVLEEVSTGDVVWTRDWDGRIFENGLLAMANPAGCTGKVAVTVRRAASPARPTANRSPATPPALPPTTTSSSSKHSSKHPKHIMDIDLHPPDDYSHRFFIWHEWILVRSSQAVDRVPDLFTPGVAGTWPAHCGERLRLFHHINVLRQAEQQPGPADADYAHRPPVGQ